MFLRLLLLLLLLMVYPRKVLVFRPPKQLWLVLALLSGLTHCKRLGPSFQLPVKVSISSQNLVLALACSLVASSYNVTQGREKKADERKCSFLECVALNLRRRRSKPEPERDFVTRDFGGKLKQRP